MIKKSDLRNIKAKILISNNFIDNDYREEVESYIIKRLNPLLNLAKRDGIFERNYKKFALKKNLNPKLLLKHTKKIVKDILGIGIGLETI